MSNDASDIVETRTYDLYITYDKVLPELFRSEFFITSKDTVNKQLSKVLPDASTLARRVRRAQ